MQFFQAAMQEMGVSAEQTLMVGDDLINDVQGATAAGMRAAWIRRGVTVSDDAETSQDVLQLSTLQQLPELFDRLSASHTRDEDS